MLLPSISLVYIEFANHRLHALSHLILTVVLRDWDCYLLLQIRKLTQVKDTVKVLITPFCFYERPKFVPVFWFVCLFANRKKPKGDFLLQKIENGVQGLFCGELLQKRPTPQAVVVALPLLCVSVVSGFLCHFM